MCLFYLDYISFIYAKTIDALQIVRTKSTFCEKFCYFINLIYGKQYTYIYWLQVIYIYRLYIYF